MFFNFINVTHIEPPTVGTETGFGLEAESVSFNFLILILTNFVREIHLSSRNSLSSFVRRIVVVWQLM